MELEYLKEFLADDVSPVDISAVIKENVRKYVKARMENSGSFAKEIYKWDLVRKWYKRDISTVEDLREWVSGALFDPTSTRKTVNNLITQSSFGDWQDGILKGERGSDDELASAMKAMRIDNFKDIQSLPINNWVNRSGQKKKIDLRIFSTYLMCHQPFDIMQVKDTEFQTAKRKWHLNIDMRNDGFVRWQSFAKQILLPLLAEEMSVEAVQPFDFSQLDVGKEFESIRNGKYLCMIDVQDFIWMTFHNAESPGTFPTIWKISHGTAVISEDEYETFAKKSVVVVHGITGAKGKQKETQGDKFISKIKKGDFFYLCRGNSIRFLGQFDSDTAVLNQEKQDDWYQRSYKIIEMSKDTSPYSGVSKWWTPNNNSTCCEVGDNQAFEQNILKPYFGLSLTELWQYNFMKDTNSMIEELKDLLLSSGQVILTGAPGTGKTYLAKQVAYALTGDNAENSPHVEFCQFHPSFDYTDFVEGLRPVNKGDGNISFERKDGIFKEFCKKAIEKSVNNFDEAYNRFAEFLSENYSKENPLELRTPNNASFRVFLNTKGSLSLQTGKRDEVQGSLTPEKIKTFLTETPYEYWAGYYLGVIDYLKKNFNLTFVADNEGQKYVFIIDEINRGDISKIFGELFYAIDSGYRGKAGKVKTQYANLISKDDPYNDGFYIPPNVYIIGTMNDIDRSVESMDFAIRRRFTWKEIEAKDAVGMWDDKIPEYKDEALLKMNSLNKAIEETESLSKAFHIGPAYFLKLKEYKGGFQKLWDLHIMPLLKEYLRGMLDSEAALENLKTAYSVTSDSEKKE